MEVICMARDFASELAKLTQQSAEAQAESGGFSNDLMYPGAFVGSHSFRIFWSTTSDHLIRLVERVFYVGADKSRQSSFNLRAIGEKAETLDLVKTLNDNKIVDLTGNYYTNTRAIFYGQFVGSTNNELNSKYKVGWTGLVMVSKKMYKVILQAITEGCSPEAYQRLTTAATGPTIVLTRGENAFDQGASLSFKEFKTAETQEEMDLILNGLGNLSEVFYHDTPTEEEIQKARELDQLYSTELRAKYLGATNQNLNPSQSAGVAGGVQAPTPGSVPPNPATQSAPQAQAPAGVDAMQNTTGFSAPQPPAGWNPNK